MAGNWTEGMVWCRQAAEAGHPGAQFNLGQAYRLGRGVETNDVEARKWYLKAAEAGVTQAEINLGLMYANGMGGPRDVRAALQWLDRAAAAGEERARAIRQQIVDQLPAGSEFRR